jgi:hypothetical protein
LSLTAKLSPMRAGCAPRSLLRTSLFRTWVIGSEKTRIQAGPCRTAAVDPPADPIGDCCAIRRGACWPSIVSAAEGAEVEVGSGFNGTRCQRLESCIQACMQDGCQPRPIEGGGYRSDLCASRAKAGLGI